MKPIRMLVPLALVAMVGLGWFVTVTSSIREVAQHGEYSKLAEESVEAGLYGQAVEQYKQAISTGSGLEAWQRIREIYRTYYAEEPTQSVRDSYLDDMLEAARHYPRYAEFWEDACRLYLETESYSKAYSLVKTAMNRGASSELLDGYLSKLKYRSRTDYKLYSDFKTALNGYIAVSDGTQWTLLDGTGTKLEGGYKLIGLVNDRGEGIYVNDIDARLLDGDGIPRARFDLNIADAGLYDSESHLVPVKVDDVWRYLDTSTGDLLEGDFQEAGSFVDGKAAAKVDDAWYLIDATGAAVSDPFEDIKLDVYGSYLQSGVVIAKRDGKYAFYDGELARQGDFECDDVDLCLDKGAIAYRQGGTWGFVSKDAEVLCEPRFHGAKSFSEGVAAVSDREHHWGFVDENFEVVIDCEYYDAWYFDSDGVAVVSTAQDSYQTLRFLFS